MAGNKARAKLALKEREEEGACWLKQRSRPRLDSGVACCFTTCVRTKAREEVHLPMPVGA